MKTVIAMLVAACCAALQACTQSGLEQKIKVDTGSLLRRGRAVVVMSAAAEDVYFFSTAPHAVETSWMASDRKMDLNKIFGTGSAQSEKSPTISEVDAGTYDLLAFSYYAANAKKFNRVVPPMPALARVTVAAGEIVYLGHLKIMPHSKPKAHIFAASQQSFTLSVLDYEAEARASLKANKPELAHLMIKRLMTITPIFLAAQPATEPLAQPLPATKRNTVAAGD